MRLFLAGLGTETNSFASFPTGLAEFHEHMWAEGSVEKLPTTPQSAPTQHWVASATALGWEVVQSLHARAQPAGPTTRAAYEFMRDRILSDLAAAGPVDAVLLFLHGAMIADGYDDCEADLVSRIRAHVGAKVRIGVELDLHANMDEAIVDAADIIVIYKAYPHNDYAERADDLFELMRRTLAGEIEPVMALFDCRVICLFPTTREGPMVGFTEEMFAAEGKDGILSLSLNHGFPWADLPIAGAKMLAIADRDIAIARRAAEDFGKRFYRVRADATLPFTPFAEAIEEAKKKGDKPLLLADTADQIGSGAPGDTTHVLKALLDAGIRNAAVVPIWDQLAVGICRNVGVGAKLKLRLGGKFEPHSGPPLDVEAEVLLLKENATQSALRGERIPIGNIAVIRVAGIEVLLSDLRINVFTPTIFEENGITLADKQVISIKNLYKHRDVFRPITRDQLFVATPGTSNPDWKSLPFQRLSRPMWPLDPDPLGLDT